MPSYIARLLSTGVAPRVAPSLKPHLSNFLYGALIRKRLPQVWWFVTESGAASLTVDQSGDATVVDGPAGEPDGRITWTDAAFRAAIELHDRSRVPPEAGPPKVEIFTRKGEEAFGQFRARFGV